MCYKSIVKYILYINHFTTLKNNQKDGILYPLNGVFECRKITDIKQIRRDDPRQKAPKKPKKSKKV